MACFSRSTMRGHILWNRSFLILEKSTDFHSLSFLSTKNKLSLLCNLHDKAAEGFILEERCTLRYKYQILCTLREGHKNFLSCHCKLHFRQCLVGQNVRILLMISPMILQTQGISLFFPHKPPSKYDD